MNAAPRRMRAECALLFFLQAGAVGMWQVCFGNVLRAYGFERFIPLAYGAVALSSFISPMFVGALADQSVPPTRLLRWLSFASAGALALTFAALDFGWGPWAMLALVQVHALCAAPTMSLLTSIVLSHLVDPHREFGPMRAWATLGWIAAGLCVSWVLQADDTTHSGYAAAATIAGVAVFSWLVPDDPPAAPKNPRTWRDRFGLQALDLFRDRNHRVVFLTAALYNAPLAAFYPYTPIHLHALGIEHATAVMTLGQTTEMLAMYGLASLFRRVPLKWLFLIGIGAGLARYALFALDCRPALLAGICLHGIAYTLYFITAQVYIENRVEPTMRVRAQALFAVMISGVGNLSGYLASGWWRNLSAGSDGETRWPLFWSGLTGAVALVSLYFATQYRGQHRLGVRN